MPRTLARRDAELASALRMSAMRLSRRLRSERTDAGLTLTQTAALGTLARCGALTPGELATAERVQPPSMTRVLAVLEAAELVTRTRHPDDGRQVLIALSESGRTLLETDRRRRDAWLAQRLVELTDDERSLLRAAAPILERLAST